MEASRKGDPERLKSVWLNGLVEKNTVLLRRASRESFFVLGTSDVGCIVVPAIPRRAGDLAWFELDYSADGRYWR